MTSEQDHPARSHRGCWTCRGKKVKCDEERPNCRRCSRLGRVCDYLPRPRKKYTRRVHGHQLGTDHSSLSTTGRSDVVLRHHSLNALPESQLSPTTAPAYDTGAAENADQDPQMLISSFLSPDCLAIVLPTDYAAIRCFCTVISTSIDTKDPEFSVPTVLCYEREGLLSESDQESLESAAVEHYGASMGLLAHTIHETADSSGLDTTLASLWLMIVYEQKFGDGTGAGLKAHLIGAASVLNSRLRNLRGLLNWDERYGVDQTSNTDQDGASPLNKWPISPFSARMIVWISFLDAGAAFYKLGGSFNKSLGKVMTGLAENETQSRLRGFLSVHRYSIPMYSIHWGSKYPQDQLLEDLQNRELFYLYGQIGQLRFLLAELTTAYENEDEERQHLALSAAHALRDIGEKYSEVLEVATRLDFNSAGARQRKFITNIRFIVPFYHSTLLCYFRATSRSASAPPNEKQRSSLLEIITLAYQSYADEGEEAMTRIAWPLFISALETVDPIHRDWIMDRFSHLQQRGENYRRAYAALKAAQREQRDAWDSIQVWEREGLEKFVI
ncbi:unnamed protein product [Clonostachys chloroleuca]|uniref:Zn(2)-C6 fungal-type domain-containing protein n=1 Tax=Clonostachys chloroleuca TaxID=1926264 RepID=A0AA35PVS4_9HYPO|nr:unnamed protein product [Clonostachys chloroleuca]